MLIRQSLIALCLLFATAAFGSSTGHREWVAAAFVRVPVSVADRTPERADLKAEHSARFVAAIAKVSANAPLPPRQWAALLMALGGAESNFDTDVVEGRCPPKRCDAELVKGERVFRARGAFQNWEVDPVRDIWVNANGSPELQVEMADRMLRRSLSRCKPFAPYPAHIFRAYGGARSCSFALKDEERRVGLYLRLLKTPMPTGAGS